jgi:hypothetical protein
MRSLPVLALALLLSGCVGTSYKSFNAPKAENTNLSRQVRFELKSAFYDDPPQCVTVLPAKGEATQRTKNRIEAAFARYLSGRVPKIIGPLERRRIEKADLFDLANTKDRRRFALAKRCPYFAQPTLGHSEDAYMVVWNEKKVALTYSLFRASDDAVLWRAAHTASRSDGGLPLSPFSLATSLAYAGRMEADKEEVWASLVDDATRRMVKTLPDVR